MEDKKPESISPELLTMLQEADANLRVAQSIKQFTVANIFRTYELNQGDTVDIQTGKISYAEAKVSPPLSLAAEKK